MSTLRKASSISFFIFFASFISYQNFFLPPIQSNKFQLYSKSINASFKSAFKATIELTQKQATKCLLAQYLKLIFNYLISQMSNNGTKLRATQQEQIGFLKKDGVIKEKSTLDRAQEIGDKILMYIKNAFWVAVAAGVIYYSNFFHNLFHNPNINQLFFEISMAGYTIIIFLMLYTSFVLPRMSGVTNIEDYNPKLVSVGAAVGVVSVISIIIAIWPVWGGWSLLIFISIWKGFFSISVFLPGGDFGNVLFLLINGGTVLSFYIIEHQGYLH